MLEALLSQSLFPFPKTVFKTLSPVSGEIKVVDFKNERRLLVGGQTQSVYPLDGNWERFEKRVWGYLVRIVTENRQPREVLLLGLGGGTFPHLLSLKVPEAKVSCVELDPVVVEVAKKYFGLDQLSRASYLVGNASEVVSYPSRFLTKADFDTLVVDLYLGNKLPEFLLGKNFLKAIKNLLSPGGKAVFNQILDRQDPTLKQEFLDKLASFFVNLKVEMVPSPARQANFIFTGECL